MDYWIPFFIALIVLLAFSIILIEQAYAFQMEVLPWYWQEKPLVCFVNLDDNQVFLSAVAMGMWNVSFNATWGESSMVGYRMENATYLHDDCTVLFHYIPTVWAEDEDTGKWGKVYGVGGCIFLDAVNASRPCYANVATTYGNGGNRTNEHVLKTVVHELGHVWGLGHVEPEDDWEERNFPQGFTIMSSSTMFQPLGIHSELMSALECRYGDDGWGGFIDKLCRGYQLLYNLV